MTKLQAVVKFNRREQKRALIGQIMLGILMIAWIFEAGKTLIQPSIVIIENVHASSVELPLVKVAEDPVDKLDESSLSEERERGEETQTSQVEDLIRKAFPEEPKVAVALFKTESGLNPTQPSTTDLMPDGRPFSTGLVQINLTQHRIGSLECHKAFRGKNYHAVVIDEDLYQKCLIEANNPKIALEKAKEIYKGRGNTFLAWGAFTNNSYLRNL